VHADAAEYLGGGAVVADVILLDGFDAFGLPAIPLRRQHTAL
jgi:spermidine synthase